MGSKSLHVHIKSKEKGNGGISTTNAIFNELSYTSRPRRVRKPRPNAVTPFKFELQALAVRTDQVYVQRLPELPKSPVEIFLDIEGLSDRGFDYLVGAPIVEAGASKYHSFWAESREDCALAAKVGWFLERNATALLIDPAALERLRERRPRQPRYIGRRLDDTRYLPGRNLVVPADMAGQAWAEVV